VTRLRTALQGTRARLTLTYATVFALVAGAAAVGFYLYAARLQMGALDESLAAQAQALGSSIDSGNGQVGFQGGQPLPAESSQGIAIAALLVDSTGKVLDSSGNAPAYGAIAAAAKQARSTDAAVYQSLTISGVADRVRAQRLSAMGAGPSGVVLVVTRSTAEMQSTLNTIAVLLATTVPLLALAASVLGYIVAGRALRPVRVIAAAARDISEHDLNRRLDMPLPPDELGELGATFDAMLARLDASFTALRRFTADAAHELRAPLAVMRSEVDVALARDRDAPDYRDSLRSLAAEIERLSRLADQLLVLARADAGALRPQRGEIDVPDFVEHVVDRWRTLAGRRGLTLVTHLADSGHLRGDADLLRRVLDNLIANALEHAPRGTAVEVGAAPAPGDPNWWLLTVTDHGPGVPPELGDRLFERFARGDPARARSGGGAGLGLALAAAIVEAHGGTLTLDADSPGARFVARLPTE
jgi:two-component system, OmpR family, heavy metal sensor histidine kinase CusS